jgi:hypothetical protein
MTREPKPCDKCCRASVSHTTVPRPSVYARILNGHNHTRVLNALLSVLVVVLAVSRVPASVVHVVDMVPMRDRDVAASWPMDMVMVLVHRMAGCLTFVVVVPVPPMKVTVVDEVHVIPVGDRDMAAPFAVHMAVFDVRVVDCAGHCCSPPYRV